LIFGGVSARSGVESPKLPSGAPMKQNANPIKTTPDAADDSRSVNGQARGRKTLEARLEDIIASEKRLAEAKRAVMAERRAAERERTASLERMIGAACMADRENAETLAAVRTALNKHFTDDKNRAFLRAEGWLLPATGIRVKGAENE
jgi:hypothetical protein